MRAYGAEVLRYYLLRAIPVGADGDYSESKLKEAYQADLANGLGNLVRRLEALCERAEYGADAEPPPEVAVAVREAAERYQFHEALRHLWDGITKLNQQVERARPWEALRSGRGADLHKDLAGWVGGIRQVGTGLRPFLPQTAEEIERRFSRPAIEVGEILFPRL